MTDITAYPPGFSSWPENEQTLYLLRTEWLATARPEQLAPDGTWLVWLILAGRGWGKTKTAAQDMSFEGMANANWRLGVVAPTFQDVRDTCFEGESGIIAALGGPTSKHIGKWNRSMAELELVNGSVFKGFPGDEPDRLRGPQFHRVWVDELAAMSRQDEAWANIEMCTRLGKHPQIIVTTTPRPTKLIRELIKRSLPPVDIEPAAALDPDQQHGPGVPRGARSLSTRNPLFDAGPIST
jgi:phage terminase large subunit-like protein